MPCLHPGQEIVVELKATTHQEMRDVAMTQPAGVEKRVCNDQLIICGIGPVRLSAGVTGAQFRLWASDVVQGAGRVETSPHLIEIAPRSQRTQVFRQYAVLVKQRQHAVSAGVDCPQVDPGMHNRASVEQEAGTVGPVVDAFILGAGKVGIGDGGVKQNGALVVRIVPREQIRVLRNEAVQASGIVGVDGLLGCFYCPLQLRIGHRFSSLLHKIAKRILRPLQLGRIINQTCQPLETIERFNPVSKPCAIPPQGAGFPIDGGAGIIFSRLFSPQFVLDIRQGSPQPNMTMVGL